MRASAAGEMKGPVGGPRTRVVLAGLSGFGATYVQALLDGLEGEDLYTLAVVDPHADACPRLPEFRKRGTKVFAELDAFFADGEEADLVILSTPIHLHAEQTILCLRHGSHVLCEKPAAATVAQARDMAEAAHAAGRTLAIGYQWSFSECTHALKRDIRSGAFGRPVRFKSLILWPRRRRYFSQRRWAGRIEIDGRVVRDSPVQNAAAHYLHNAFYLLGECENSAASAVGMRAVVARANDIENYDTACVRTETAAGAEILQFCSHATDQAIGPLLTYEFERAVVSYHPEDGFEARHADGRIHGYGDPTSADSMLKLRQTVDCVRGRGINRCPAEAALPHTWCVEAIQQSIDSSVPTFPAHRIRSTAEGPDGIVYVEGLGDRLQACYEEGVLPAGFSRIG